MKVTINGEEKEFEGEMSVSALLEQLQLKDKRAAVELNGVTLFPRDHDTTTVHDGDAAWILVPTAGG